MADFIDAQSINWAYFGPNPTILSATCFAQDLKVWNVHS